MGPVSTQQPVRSSETVQLGPSKLASMTERGEFYEHEKESFGTFIYNKNEGTVMGRTGTSWSK